MRMEIVKFVFPLLATLFSIVGVAQIPNAPLGWATCASLTGGSYPLKGGGNGSMIRLTSNGGDMWRAIADAIAQNDVIVLDGQNGDFVLSRSIKVKNSRNKTIVGINGARLCTQFYVTPAIRAALDSVGVLSLSGAAETGGTLSNGLYVSEQNSQRKWPIRYVRSINNNAEQSDVLPCSWPNTKAKSSKNARKMHFSGIYACIYKKFLVTLHAKSVYPNIL